MSVLDEADFDIGLAFSLPEEFLHDPFEYREQIANLMVEAGWPQYHSAGFGCGYGDIAWTVKLTEASMIDSLAILIDRVSESLETLKIRRQVPAEPVAWMDEVEQSLTNPVDPELTPEQRLIKAIFSADDGFDPEAAYDEAYRATFGYKPTMDVTALHMWAQDLIEKLSGEPFNAKDYL